MGYYTYFEMEIVGAIDEKAFSKDFEDITGYNYETLDTDSIKWYEYEGDMKTLSEKYPNNIFKVHGNGEENDDMWYEVHFRGESTRVEAEVVIPTIDIGLIGNAGKLVPELLI